MKQIASSFKLWTEFFVDDSKNDNFLLLYGHRKPKKTKKYQLRKREMRARSWEQSHPSPQFLLQQFLQIFFIQKLTPITLGPWFSIYRPA